jgi:hypothetical protein
MFCISMYTLSPPPPHSTPLLQNTEPGSVNKMGVCCMGRVRQESSQFVPSPSLLIASPTVAI